MKQILVAVAVIVGLTLFMFGDSLPTNLHQIKTGTFNLEARKSGVVGRVFSGFGGN